MANNLVIVESPAKAKTIGKFLGKNYKVVASVGHIRDLPKSRLGIDIENDFEPEYINIRGKGPIINELKKEAKNKKKIFLATDPDREGEAISWHLAYILDIDEEQEVRVEFNEITKDAIKNAVKKPRKIDLNLVDAQQTRRILDRLVGYKISPLLWKKIRRGLSAGRVQSVATKLICDREEEIENFVPQEYWSIKALLEKEGEKFEANYFGRYIDNKEVKIELNNKEEVDEVLNQLDIKKFIVTDVKKGVRRRNPYAPYTTSTLQQDASKKLGFSTKKTMMVAQQLYEGIDIKGVGTEGLITYMRTDSTRVSKEAMNGAKEYILERYGEKYSTGGRNYGNNSKKETQDAHEGIRPTLVRRSPDDIANSLTKDQYRLYKMIWERFLGSQMPPAVYETLSVSINNNNEIFRASGSKLTFDGFLRIYKTADEEEKDMEIPSLAKEDKVIGKKIEPKQHFTQPPARYTEASLIKVLEELGIGRPSTFAPTISTILARDYVVLENRSFLPTELGILVNDLLKDYFNEIVNEEFTAELEEKLDDVAEGNFPWKEVVRDFYKDFEKHLNIAEEEVKAIEIEDEETDVICEKCGRNMVIKRGRFGKFLACPGYPECKNTKAIVDELDVPCPICENGKVVRRKSKRGRTFYGCTNYPDCTFVSWSEPVKEKCKECNAFMIIKRSRNKEEIKCSNKDCPQSK